MTVDQQTTDYLRAALGAVHLRDVRPPTEEERWLLPGIVCSTNTLLYGTSSAGKSLAVANIIASLTDGREFLGVRPNATGLRVLVLCSDRGAEQEFAERFKALGVSPDVYFFPGVSNKPQAWWDSMHELARRDSAGLVVIDHASGVLDGDELAKEPWRELWTQRVEPFGCPVILVAHASDYAGERGPAHRVMGNSGAAQFARTEVEIYATGANRFANSPRVLRSKSRYGDGVERRFIISDGGLLVRDTDGEQAAGERSRQRAQTSLDANHRIALAAVQSCGRTVAQVAADVARATGDNEDTLRKRKLPALVRSGVLCKRDSDTGGIYAPGPNMPS